MPAGVANVMWKFNDDGFAGSPDGLGVGVEIDELRFDAVNADPNRTRRRSARLLRSLNVSAVTESLARGIILVWLPTFQSSIG
jgi:hypothetical protein